MEGLTLVLLGTLAIVLVGVLPSIREARRRNFKAVFGFDPEAAKKYGRLPEGMGIVGSLLDALRLDRDQARTALGTIPLQELKLESGAGFQECERRYRQAERLARKYEYLPENERLSRRRKSIGLFVPGPY